MTQKLIRLGVLCLLAIAACQPQEELPQYQPDPVLQDNQVPESTKGAASHAQRIDNSTELVNYLTTMLGYNIIEEDVYLLETRRIKQWYFHEYIRTSAQQNGKYLYVKVTDPLADGVIATVEIPTDWKSFFHDADFMVYADDDEPILFTYRVCDGSSGSCITVASLSNDGTFMPDMCNSDADCEGFSEPTITCYVQMCIAGRCNFQVVNSETGCPPDECMGMFENCGDEDNESCTYNKCVSNINPELGPNCLPITREDGGCPPSECQTYLDCPEDITIDPSDPGGSGGGGGIGG